MIAQLRDMGLSMEGELRISLSVPRNFADELKALKDEQLDVEIKKHREKRSRNANSYLWEIIGKLKDKLRISKDECYLLMLQRYGQGGLVSVPTKNWDMVKREIKYYEIKGHGKAGGVDFTHVFMWVGSSEYSSMEMAVLIDGVVSEAKEQGIDCDTPEQIMLMDERYKARYGTV